MIHQHKTYQELVKELQDLKQQYDFIKVSYDTKIIEAKKTEETLKEGENRYRSLIDLAVDGILLGSHEGIITDANQSMCSMVDIAKEELIGKHISKISFTPESLIISPFRFDLLQNGEIVINERVLKRPDGIEVTVEMRTKMMPDGTYQSIYRDITKRKQAEQALQESEERLKAITESAPDIIAELDRKGTILYMSRVLPGFTLEDVIGKNFCDWVAPEYHEIMMHCLDLVFQESVQQTYQIPGLGPNAEMRWYRSSLSPIYVGGVVKNAVLISTDITEQKKAESEILKEKHFNEKLLDSLPVIFYLYDKDLRLRKWNKAHVDELGYSPEELEGFPVVNWHQSEEAKVLVKSSINHVLEHNTFISIEATLYHKNGEGIPYLLTGVRFDSTEGPMLMGVGVNITNLKNAENELIKAKEKAEESDQLKTAFLQNMSHEIRTPMNAIMGFSELIVDYFNDKPKIEKFSEIINQRCNDLLDIINDILDIAKIESVQLPINIEECNLDELFGELTSFFTEYQKRSRKQHIAFSLQTQNNPLGINIATDKVKLKQILINLISNAFKFTDSGSIEGGCRLDGKSNLIFYVSDTGIGIPPDKQHAVFERFAQLNPGANKLVSGTGLGLSIVKGLVTLLGGEIFVESEVGKGTTFSFTIPYRIIQPNDNKPSKIAKIEDYHFSNKTILVVEDDKPNAEYLKEILTRAGFMVIHSEYGNEAVKMALSSTIDLILMDIRLPDIDGYEATRQIKLRKPLSKIIAQTAYASHMEKQKALDSGCNDYISKPIKKELLMSMIRNLLHS